MKQKLESVKEYIQNIDVLNVEQLDTLSQRFEYKLAKIKKAKQRIYDNQLSCVICMDKRRNIVIQGCNHFVICDECERKLVLNKCPQCQRAYSNIIKLRL